jgi:hypothetical protein
MFLRDIFEGVAFHFCSNSFKLKLIQTRPVEEEKFKFLHQTAQLSTGQVSGFFAFTNESSNFFWAKAK